MESYRSIKNLYKRDPKTHKLIVGSFARPEFDLLKNVSWYMFEKLDGTNIRILWDGSSVEFRGRTNSAQMHGGLIKVLQDTFPPDVLDKAFPDISPEHSVCIYGEGFGAGIQSGTDYTEDGGQLFAAFDIKIGRWWLRQADVLALCSKMGCGRAPYIGTGDLIRASYVGSRPFGSALGRGFKIAEGIVCRPVCDLWDRTGNRVIVKIKHKDYSAKDCS